MTTNDVVVGTVTRFVPEDDAPPDPNHEDRVRVLNDQYKARWAAESGRKRFDVTVLQEWLRIEHAKLIAERDNKPLPSHAGGEVNGGAARKRKGWKAELVGSWADANLDNVFDPEELAIELKVSAPTVYNWITANRDRVLKLGRAQYQVVDRTDERDAK